MLVSDEIKDWPDGADVVIKSSNSPQFVVSQVQAFLRRISIERSVSPLTGLPGALATEMEIESRFQGTGSFHACYVDVNSFKPFNDVYGFEKGDMVIKALSEKIVESVTRFEVRESFCGHIGGDDFVVLSRGIPDGAMRWLALEFDRLIRGFYREVDVSRGGIVSLDREGKRKRFPLMSVSIVSVRCGNGFLSREEMARELAALKRKAKQEAACAEGSVFLSHEAGCGELDADSLIARLIADESRPPSWRRAAIEAAGELHLEATIEPLRLLLKRSPDEKLRKSSAYSLGRMRDGQNLGGLMEALSDRSAHVRMRAAEALGEIGDARALQALISAAADSSPHVRCASLLSIGRIGMRSAVVFVAKATLDRSVDVRVSAIKALGALGGTEAFGELARCMEEGPISVTHAVAEALGYIPHERTMDMLCSLLEKNDTGCIWRAAHSTYVLAKSGFLEVEKGRVCELLLRALNGKDGYVLRACALALGALGEKKALLNLIGLLGDSREYVRSAAAMGLGKIGDSRALGPLRSAMRDGRSSVRSNAAWALGELGCPEAIETLRVSLKDRTDVVREMAASAICRLLQAGNR
jgi:HEAT repeat protein/GGDEF domain-containing protein